MLRRYKRGIAVLLLVTFAQQIFGPGTVWALTGGPSQPEVNSFEPVGTNQMVDLTTGDFNYNIPLMVVPGPNGGYPINLAYHAGIGMEQEASWVGLGWNINPGAITRNLRGVPDDFSGDKIKEAVNLKKNVTVGLTATGAQLIGEARETVGVEPERAAPIVYTSIYFNNYRGVGYNISASGLSILRESAKLHSKSITFGVSLNSETGLGVSPSIGLGVLTKDYIKKSKRNGFNVSIGLNSKQGLESFKLSWNKRRLKNKLKRIHPQDTKSAGVSFVTHSPINTGNFSMQGYNVSTQLTVSKMKGLVFKKNTKADVMVVTSKVAENELNSPSYGALYLGNVGLEDNQSVLDHYVYNDVPISKHAVNMGMPVMNTDVFTITGQGIGGSFRAHRNDIGRFYDAKRTSKNTTNSTGGEFGFGKNGPFKYFHVGADQSVNNGGNSSYSGRWKQGNESLKNHTFTQKTPSKPRYEPFYFKVAGSLEAKDITEWNRVQGEQPIAFNLGLKSADGIAPTPVVKNSLFGMGATQIESRSKSSDRVKRAQNIAYRTKEEIRKDEFYSTRSHHIYQAEEYPDKEVGGVLTGAPIDYTEIDHRSTTEEADKHIHEYTVLKPDGTRYTYGLPAYNTLKKDVIFANTSHSIAAYNDEPIVSYDATNDAALTNDEGQDNYYSSNEIPSYVHSHMLTQITSADYVDLTGNGPSTDDFGFYAKFNYVKVEDYQWRDPYFGANYIKGYYSNEEDDKASYTYGKKDLYYVHSIETKTHVAIFELGDRADGKEALGEHPAGFEHGEASQKYLKKIHLYSKNDPNYGESTAVPLQTVHFVYDYSLCPGIFNKATGPNDPEHISVPDAPLTNQGKLTLRKVFITYNGNEKGRLSPYSFDYTTNKPYNRLNVDRWGNYQESVNPNEHAINPYTRQDLSTAETNTNASAWCLSTINLPSGGTITVDYEADDYGYVQDKRAAQMVEIVGFSETSATTAPTLVGVVTEDGKKLKKKNLRLWFKADKLSGETDPALRKQIIGDYVAELDEIYFKVFENLRIKKGTANKAKDYVVGYAQVNTSATDYYGADVLPGKNYGYIDLKPAEYKSAGLNGWKTHPFKKAGWQYLRYNRTDLFNAEQDFDNFKEVGQSAVTVALMISKVGLLLKVLSESISIIALGQYNKYNMLGYCKKMNTDKTSFIRLNSPQKLKYGGGHRVGKITLADNWVEGQRSFGTTYRYVNKDGSTSGVADYEPIVGGEENCLKKPVWFNGNENLLNFSSKDLFIETPISEALYPSPRVVYGRVETRNLEYAAANKSQSSISVHEFYTAKDFPVKEVATKLNRTGYNLPVYVPFVGTLEYSNNGYSQGYAVELNDMSGKPRAVSKYAYKEGAIGSDDKPFSRVQYHYNMNAKGELENKVDVLDGHGIKRKAILGVEQDFTIHEEEHSSSTDAWLGETNLETIITTGLPFPPYALPPIFMPTLFPNNYSHSESMFRGISTSKVIYKTGILAKVEAFSDGSTVMTENLVYDAETGEPLLTSVTNEWDKPVYNYQYAAHWNYEGMEGAYQNYKAALFIEPLGSTYQLLTSPTGDYIPPAEVLTLGDEITVEVDGVLKKYYVVDVDPLDFKLEDRNGDAPSFSARKATITRSGHRNMQSVKSGSVTALSQAFLTIDLDLSSQFVLWNNTVTGADPQYGMTDPTYFNMNTMSESSYTWRGKGHFIPNFYNCQTGNYENIRIQMFDINEIQFSKGCKGTLTFRGTTPASAGHIVPTTITDELGTTVTSLTEQLVNFKIISEIRDGEGHTVSVEMLHIPSGTVYPAVWNPGAQGHSCWANCGAADILHADAIEFSDDWGDSYPYADLGNPVNADNVPIATSTLNKYRYGKKGIWRAKKTYLYQTNRTQNADEGIAKNTRINIDGEYEPWTPYNWKEGINPKWDWVSEITRYSPYGYAIEERSRLGYDAENAETAIYSSQMYGYQNSVVTATSALASYFEIGSNGFEQVNAGEDANNIGHFNFASALTASNVKAHTGANSIEFLDGQSNSFNLINTGTEEQVLKAKAGKDYLLSLWVNVEEAGAVGTLSTTVGGVTVTVNTSNSRTVIDGWKKIEIKFTMPATPLTLTYTSTGKTYIDDLRFGPYDGGMVTYVYDPKNLWLVAELDGLNYATFYNYDEEGNLVQVKKETEEGIVTVQTSRSNTKQR